MTATTLCGRGWAAHTNYGRTLRPTDNQDCLKVRVERHHYWTSFQREYNDFLAGSLAHAELTDVSSVIPETAQ